MDNCTQCGRFSYFGDGNCPYCSRIMPDRVVEVADLFFTENDKIFAHGLGVLV